MKKLLFITLITAVGVGSIHAATLIEKARDLKAKHDAAVKKFVQKPGVQKTFRKAQAFATGIPATATPVRAAAMRSTVPAPMRAMDAPAVRAGVIAATLSAIRPMSKDELKKGINQLKQETDNVKDEMKRAEKEYAKFTKDATRARQKNNLPDMNRLRRLRMTNRTQFRVMDAKFRMLNNRLGELNRAQSMGTAVMKPVAEPTTTHGGPGIGMMPVAEPTRTRGGPAIAR